MHGFIKLIDSSVFQKAVAAATGLGLVCFVIVHMLGNLQVFLGQDSINGYAVKLKNFGGLLWAARIVLLALIVLHIATTVRLNRRNRTARQGRYAVAGRQASTRSSRNMIVSGSVILAFIVFHLAHFTFGWIQPELYRLTDSQGRHDVYTMVTLGLESWAIAAFYLVALLFLCSHLSHAAFSAFQSLGANIGGKDTLFKPAARYVAVATIIGFASVPVAVLMGWFSK